MAASQVPVERRPLMNGSDFCSSTGPVSSMTNGSAPVNAAAAWPNLQQLTGQTRKNRKITLAATVIALVVNICFFIIVIVLVQRRPSIGDEPQQCQVDSSNSNVTLKDTELFEELFREPASTVDACVDICYNNASCVAITYCLHCTPDRESYQLCYMYAENLPTDKPKYAVIQTWESVIILSKLEEELIFVNTAISGVEIPLRTRVRTLRRCLAACLDEFCCVGFTFSPNKDERCKLYSDEKMSLFAESGTTTHFVSPHAGKP